MRGDCSDAAPGLVNFPAMSQPTNTPVAYPPAERLPLVERLPAGAPTHTVADPYRWLEDADDPRTQAWSAAQEELFGEHRDQWAGRDAVHDRVRELLSAGTVGPPVWRGERRFLVRRTGDQEHGVLLVVEPGGAGGEQERVLVDPIAVDPSGATTLDAWQPSKEGHLLAYQLSTGGTEESVLRVLDVATGEDIDGPIDRARYSPVAWLPGGEQFYYVRRLDPAGLPEDERQYHRRVWLHTVGQDVATDVEVFGAGRAMTSYYGVSVSLDGRWLAVSAAEGTAPRSDVWLADLATSSHAAPVLVEVAVGLDAHTGAHVGRDGRLYVGTDLDASRGRLAVADPRTPGREHWRDLLAERPDAVLEDYTVLDGAELGDAPVLLASWTTHAVSEVTVHDLATGALRGQVPLPGLGTVGGLLARPEGGHEAWFTWTDHTTLPHVYRYDARTGELSLWASPPGDIQDVPPVVSRQLETSSADGTTVRMFVVARADRVDSAGAPLATAPTILYGYGGFGVSLTPGYSATALAWVEAGGVYAVANLRGGSEEGEDWHRDGMRAVKQHTFDDFAACADALGAGGWTTPAQLAISGGSNGGLLVGAAMTQRPEAYAAVICAAPLLDMVRYQLHGLGITWTEEYGDAESPEELGWLLGYSPYHAVRDGERYPATLFTVFDGDTRVDPLHARKLAAALQHATSAPPSEAPVLLRREKDVGHGARAISRTVDLVADTLAFAAHHTGLELRADSDVAGARR
jgi:prolyl oligopeptidase